MLDCRLSASDRPQPLGPLPVATQIATRLAGRLPRPEQLPPPAPPRLLDDTELRAAAEAATKMVERPEPFPKLVEPALSDPGRAAAELSERHRDLTERRAAPETETASLRAQLEATEGPFARRRHRQQREDWQPDLWVRSQKRSAIDGKLPWVETRLNEAAA